MKRTMWPDYMGLDPEPVRELARTTSTWQGSVDSALRNIQSAEALTGEPINVTPQLDQIASDGQSMSNAITSAVDEVESFRIPDVGTYWSGVMDGMVAGPTSSPSVTSPAASWNQFSASSGDPYADQSRPANSRDWIGARVGSSMDNSHDPFWHAAAADGLMPGGPDTAPPKPFVLDMSGVTGSIDDLVGEIGRLNGAYEAGVDLPRREQAFAELTAIGRQVTTEDADIIGRSAGTWVNRDVAAISTEWQVDYDEAALLHRREQILTKSPTVELHLELISIATSLTAMHRQQTPPDHEAESDGNDHDPWATYRGQAEGEWAGLAGPFGEDVRRSVNEARSLHGHPLLGEEPEIVERVEVFGWDHDREPTHDDLAQFRHDGGADFSFGTGRRERWIERTRIDGDTEDLAVLWAAEFGLTRAQALYELAHYRALEDRELNSDVVGHTSGPLSDEQARRNIVETEARRLFVMIELKRLTNDWTDERLAAGHAAALAYLSESSEPLGYRGSDENSRQVATAYALLIAKSTHGERLPTLTEDERTLAVVTGTDEASFTEFNTQVLSVSAAISNVSDADLGRGLRALSTMGDATALLIAVAENDEATIREKTVDLALGTLIAKAASWLLPRALGGPVVAAAGLVLAFTEVGPPGPARPPNPPRYGSTNEYGVLHSNIICGNAAANIDMIACDRG